MTEEENKILDIYNKWSESSRSGDIVSMRELVIPGSEFSTLTELYYRNWFNKTKYYYQFHETEIFSSKQQDRDFVAEIRGLIEIIGMNNQLQFKGSFQSRCIKNRVNKAWKLHQIEIEWE